MTYGIKWAHRALERGDGREAKRLDAARRRVRSARGRSDHSQLELGGVAVGPDGAKLQGTGESPHDALAALTVQLRGLSR